MPRRAIYQRDKAKDPQKVKAQRRAQHERHKEREKRRHLEWSRQPDVAERRRREHAARMADPEIRLMKCAKDILSRATGLSQRVLPAALVAAEMERLRLNRAIKEAR